MKEKILNIIKESAKLLLIFLVVILLFTTILWFVKITISPLHLPLEFAISIGIYLLIQYVNKYKKQNKQEKRKQTIQDILTIILSAIVFSVSVLFSTLVYDATADGNTYHKLAVGCMKNGWNPVYESCKDFTEEDGNVFNVSDDNINYLWADHYAVGTEIIGANIYSFTNHIESGKAFTLVMMYACFGIVLYYLAEKKNINIFVSILITFVLVVNPITVTQIGTYYVDSLLAMSLFLIIYALLRITEEKDLLENNNKENFLVLALSIALCVNAKFTGLAFAAIFCIVFYVYWLIMKWRKGKEEFIKEFKFDTIFYIVTVLVSICIIGFSSYTKNTIQYGHPLYPLYGKGHVENMVNKEAPSSFKNKNHIQTFFISLFAKGENVSPSYSTENNQPDLKIPFTLSKEEINNYKIPDIRMAGFGPLFSGAVVIGTLTTIIMFVDFIKNKRWKELTIFSLIMGTIVCLIVALDGNYWARYIPYFYVLPIINLAYLARKKEKLSKVLETLIIITLLVNSLTITYIALKGYIENTRYARNNLKTVRLTSESQEEPIKIKLNHMGLQGVLYNLDDLGINFEVVNEIHENAREGFFFKY